MVGAGRCPAPLGKNQVLSFFLLTVLSVWNWLEALEPGNFWGILHHLPAEPQLGQERGDSASVSRVEDWGLRGGVFLQDPLLPSPRKGWRRDL